MLLRWVRFRSFVYCAWLFLKERTVSPRLLAVTLSVFRILFFTLLATIYAFLWAWNEVHTPLDYIVAVRSVYLVVFAVLMLFWRYISG